VSGARTQAARKEEPFWISYGAVRLTRSFLQRITVGVHVSMCVTDAGELGAVRRTPLTFLDGKQEGTPVAPPVLTRPGHVKVERFVHG
jgi:hypothetical protein